MQHAMHLWSYNESDKFIEIALLKSKLIPGELLAKIRRAIL